jgi:hypothetical protein
MNTRRQLHRNRLILFAFLVGVPAMALVAYVALGSWALSGFGS